MSLFFSVLVEVLRPRCYTLVCLSDLQLSREIFPVFESQCGLISIYCYLVADIMAKFFKKCLLTVRQCSREGPALDRKKKKKNSPLPNI